ncbi:DUF418 domain-containing protein [Parvularcula sp. LCG005]|uniref:DUF418 domain-containing protein n=1 Tax=Parvularcula sp. LCG005 TaxID=3078805 RepID=UPI002942BFE2|nr:DUF418 domain-containing protein [Parvularcula sp. LCG005]WOI53718.1 DUF418 domain-containing protein [Parvularcula sp. LCG005]
MISSPTGGPAPTPADQRIVYIDVLRGVAVLMIFVVNIKGMTMPFPYYINPWLWPSPLDEAIAIGQRFVVDDKWRTIFTALYGAGLVLVGDRYGEDARRLLARRNGWLIAFGLIHMIGIWIGDILFFYGVTGLIAMRFSKMSVSRLFWWGGFCLLLGTIWSAGAEMAPLFDDLIYGVLKDSMWAYNEEVMGYQIAAMLSGVPEQLQYRLGDAVGYIFYYFLGTGFWLVTLGLMVLGMAFYRAGLLQGRWSVRTCLWIAVPCLAAAWALDAAQLIFVAGRGGTYDAHLFTSPFLHLDGYLGALGYAALISVMVSRGWPLRRLAAVGRMAFTNYIACSLIGTTIAGGHTWGLAWFGQVALWPLLLVVIGTMILLLIISPWYLSYFRYGPLEWLWRSLVYRRLQPILKRG